MATKSIVNNGFRIYTAQKFLEGLFQTQLSDNNLFLWIGKIIPWSNDSNPDQPNDTDSSRSLEFPDMLAIKKVSPSDASLVIPRINWTSSTVYSQYNFIGALDSGNGIRYDQFEPLTGTNLFYVLTTDNNVYKCIGNNSGAASSVMPTGKSTSNITLSDGYIWKFMYSLNSTDIQKFLTDSWIPIHVINSNDGSDQWTVQQTAVPASNTPPGGHGSNAAGELGAEYIMVSIEYQYDESGKVTVNNSFRKFGLILNPKNFAGTHSYFSLIGVLTTNLTITSPAGSFTNNETVTGGTSHATGVVVDYIGGLLRLSNVSGTFVATELLTGGTSHATGIVSSIALPDVQTNSGSMLYTEYTSAYSRASNQIDNFQVVLSL